MFGDCVGSEVTRAAASKKKGATKAKAKTKDKQVLCHHIDCARRSLAAMHANEQAHSCALATSERGRRRTRRGRWGMTGRR